MQLLVYLLACPFLWLISRLPFRGIYMISDLLYVILFHIVGYRRKVVRSNLELVFPTMETQLLRRTERAFYRHLCDMFLEMIKAMRMSKRQQFDRYRYIGMDRLSELVKSKSAIVLTPHYGNWEWSNSIGHFLSSRVYYVYQIIGNRYFDAMTKKLRSKWNAIPLQQKETPREMVRNEREGILALYGIVADQSPQARHAQLWADFMGVEVPVYNGPELLARKLNLAVFFARVSKVSRGHYTLELIPITTAGSATSPGYITEQFLRLTEEEIRKEPAYYLWTHRRWKHRGKAPKRA